MSSMLLAAPAAEDTRAPLPGTGVAAVELARAAARARLRDAHALADPRADTWRYMPLRALESQALPAAPVPAGMPALEAVQGPRLVFADGHFIASASVLEGLPPGVRWLPLARMQAADWQRHARLLEREGEAAPDDWNLAYARGGCVLELADGAVCAQPLEIVHIAVSTGASAWHARSLVRLGRGARLCLRERLLGAGAGVASLRTCWQLGDGARLDLVQQQQAGPALRLLRRDRFTLAAGSLLRLHALELGAALSRHELAVRLDGTAAAVELRQLSVLDARQHAEQVLDVRHAVGDTRSDLRCRAVAAARARAVLHGAVRIEPGADGSDAALDTRNLLLSGQAEVDARPTMEILADEVRAAHGASVGQIDAGMLFYLRARGIPLAQARALLVAAHGRGLLADIGDARLRAGAEAALDARVAALE